MKRFRYRKLWHVHFCYVILMVLFITLFLLCYYDRKISPKVVDIATSKLTEITTLYVKKNIIPVDVDLMKLAVVSKNSKDEILMVDVDYSYAYEIMKKIVEKIQNSIEGLENGEIDDFGNSRELKTNGNQLFLSLPIGLSKNGALFSSLGPKIPIKISFYEHVLGTIETKVEAYGINNSLLKVMLILDVDQKLIFPYQEKLITQTYILELGSKVILGTVPSIYGGSLLQKTNILEE